MAIRQDRGFTINKGKHHAANSGFCSPPTPVTPTTAPQTLTSDPQAPGSQASGPPPNTSLMTDPLVLEQILFNLVDNAAKYAAGASDRRIHLQVERSASHVAFRVRDHGPGVPHRKGRRLFRPFSKTAEEAAISAPGVGLGLALCHRLAGDLGGALDYESSCQAGASFCLTLPLTHPGR